MLFHWYKYARNVLFFFFFFVPSATISPWFVLCLPPVWHSNSNLTKSAVNHIYSSKWIIKTRNVRGIFHQTSWALLPKPSRPKNGSMRTLMSWPAWSRPDVILCRRVVLIPHLLHHRLVVVLPLSVGLVANIDVKRLLILQRSIVPNLIAVEIAILQLGITLLLLRILVEQENTHILADVPISPVADWAELIERRRQAAVTVPTLPHCHHLMEVNSKLQLVTRLWPICGVPLVNLLDLGHLLLMRAGVVPKIVVVVALSLRFRSVFGTFSTIGSSIVVCIHSFIHRDLRWRFTYRSIAVKNKKIKNKKWKQNNGLNHNRRELSQYT